VCGYRLSYYGKGMTADELTGIFNESREIAGIMVLALPLHQPGARRRGFNVPATMTTGG